MSKSGRERQLLLEAFRAGVAAADPERALTQALTRTVTSPDEVTVIAGGKAAVAMAGAALRVIDERSGRTRGAIAVAPASAGTAGTRLLVMHGDHPHPGPGSRAAADAIGSAARGAAPGECWVLLSGGFSSLAAAPVAGLSDLAFDRLFEALLASGLDIGQMNAVRRRMLRWGGGRLAAALRGARVRVFAISDVPGDRAEDIGSGPCSPDPRSLTEVLAIVQSAALESRLAAEVTARLEADASTTLRPGDPVFDAVTFEIVARNADAVEAAVRHLGPRANAIVTAALAGPARDAGALLGRRLVGSLPGACLVAGGETTVALGAHRAAGGRCQEAALAAAQVLAGRDRVALLVAGTDGRDGTTDAAGALVDGGTWHAIAARGIDPADALSQHRAHDALDAVGALVRTGPTGTNVMDLAVGMRW